MINESFDSNLKPYLTYSTLFHAAFFVALFWIAHRPSIATNQVYRIDFIGPTSGIINREVEAASEKAASARPAATSAMRPPPLQKSDEFPSRKKKRHRFSLPRPSILGNDRPAPSPSPAPEPAPAAANPGPAANGPAGAASGTVSADIDMPNFPYPWYITTIRTALWSQWSAHMPSGGGETLVSFSIMKDGSVVDLSVESSSGDRGVDYTALSAVQDSEPFAPLPREFQESFLRVHVRFKTQ